MSDKTGTLTQNDMIFKKIDTEFAQFHEDSLNYLTDLLKTSFLESNGPLGDINPHLDGNH